MQLGADQVVLGIPFSKARAETISYYKGTRRAPALKLPELSIILRFSPKLSCSDIQIILRVDDTTPREPHLTDVFRVRLLYLHFSFVAEFSFTILKIDEIRVYFIFILRELVKSNYIFKYLLQ